MLFTQFHIFPPSLTYFFISTAFSLNFSSFTARLLFVFCLPLLSAFVKEGIGAEPNILGSSISLGHHWPEPLILIGLSVH